MVHRSGTQLEELSTPAGTAVRKVDPSDFQIWMASFTFYPVVKSLSVDTYLWKI